MLSNQMVSIIRMASHPATAQASCATALVARMYMMALTMVAHAWFPGNSQ